MPKSQNGWTVLENRPPYIKVPGTVDTKIAVRPGNVAVVLIEVARRFNEEVEPLDGGLRDEWGWAYRPIRGKETGFSNHASATAIDLNATKHPRGVKNTFTAKKKKAVRTILDDFVDPVTGECVIRWGEDYSTTVDGMHFEINADAKAVARVVTLLREKNLDFLEKLMALDPAERAAFLDEVSDLVVRKLLNAEVALGPWAKVALNQPDGNILVKESLALSAAGAVAANEAIQKDLPELRK